MRSPKQRLVVLLFLFLFIMISSTACSVAGASDEEIGAKWESSAHADKEARAFTRWHNEDPQQIPANCAKCHSTPAYLDFLGEDGSTPGQVDQPAPVGTTVECEACHNETAAVKDSAVMPSSIELTSLGAEANCMECHQGRASAVQVNEAVAGRPPGQVDKEIRLPNLHNNAAGPTIYGAEARGGGEYDDKVYNEKFYHLSDTCITCHDPHTLQVKVENCSACHLGATTIEGVRNIRLSKIDYDGDGDVSEGLSGEIVTMQQKLLIIMRIYALATEDVDPIDFNGRFVNEAGENYTTWTPELMQAAYNYQYATIDPGSYAHNALYVMQLLYDSNETLGGTITGMTRP